MTAPVFYASQQSFLGVAKETVPGTAETAPTFWVPLISPNWTPNQTVINNEAMYGDMAKVHGAVTGSRYDTISYSTHPVLDTLMPHMLALLGGTDTVTGTAAPYSHKVSLLNTGTGQPPSYTLWMFNGAEAWRMVGSVLGKVAVDLKADALGQVDLEWTGLAATKVTTPTNTPSTAAPWPGSNTVITVGGVTASTYSDVKLNYIREVKPIITATGTATPYAIFGGAVEASIDVNGVYTGYTGSELEKLITNSQQIITVACNAANDATHTGTWTHSVTRATKAQPKQSAGSWVEIDSTFEAISNATDAVGGGTSPCSFTLVNTTATPF